MDGVGVRPYFSITGIYLARGWVLWYWRYRKQKTLLCAGWGVLIIILLQMSYQMGIGGPMESTSARIASKGVVTTFLAEVSTPAVASAQVPPTPAPAPAAAAASAAPVAPAVQSFVYARHGGNNYAYGNCTYYVANRRNIPGNWGNARSWLYNSQRDGFATGSVPRVGAIAWTGAGYLGHVAMVEAVNGGQVQISEMNGYAGFNRVGNRWVPAGAFAYIY